MRLPPHHEEGCSRIIMAAPLQAATLCVPPAFLNNLLFTYVLYVVHTHTHKKVAGSRERKNKPENAARGNRRDARAGVECSLNQPIGEVLGDPEPQSGETAIENAL